MASSTGDTKPTTLEVTESLNGFDEIAIEQAFGRDLDDLNGRHYLRALIFIMKRRDGVDVVKAKRAAMEVPIKELGDHFAEEEEEVFEDEPETEQGKGGSAPE